MVIDAAGAAYGTAGISAAAALGRATKSTQRNGMTMYDGWVGQANTDIRTATFVDHVPNPHVLEHTLLEQAKTAKCTKLAHVSGWASPSI